VGRRLLVLDRRLLPLGTDRIEHRSVTGEHLKARTQAINALAALLVIAPGYNQNSKPRTIANNPYTSVVRRRWWPTRYPRMKVSTPWRLPADLGVVRLGVGRGRPRSEEQDRGAESPAAQLCPLRAQTSRPSGGGHAPALVIRPR
jgi:hypothetical protein